MDENGVVVVLVVVVVVVPDVVGATQHSNETHPLNGYMIRVFNNYMSSPENSDGNTYAYQFSDTMFEHCLHDDKQMTFHLFVVCLQQLL